MFDDPWLPFAPRAEAAGRPLLYCLPPAGGAASMYHPWIKALAATVDVRPLQLPGRESRMHEEPVTDLVKLAAAVAEALDTENPAGYHLFGHSLGGVVAFETARALRRAGATPPRTLVVSASRPPQSRTGGETVPADDDGLIAFLRFAEGTPEAVFRAPALLAMILPVLRADLRASADYRYEPGPPLATPILALGGHTDRVCPPALLDDWAACTAGGFRTRMFTGGHFYLQKAPDFLDVLREELRAGVRPSTP